MKIILSLVFVFLLSTACFSQTEAKTDSDTSSTVVETAAIWNTLCPIMQEDVDPSVQTVLYKGKVIGFCCEMCVKKFKSDPEKYYIKLSIDGKTLKSKEKED